MAEGKKSFVLYADLISVVEKLIEKDREDGTNISGELFFHILEYVNDRHPKSDNFIVEMAFEPIRLQLKRDLQRYEQIRAKRAESGKLGGRPQKQEKAKKANGFSEKQTKAKKADTVNVNDNDTVLSKDNKHDGVLKKTPSTLHSVCKNIFIEKFKSLFNDEYYWEAKDGANLNPIIKKIKFNRDKKGMSTDDDSVSVAFGLFLDSITDRWILENFSIQNINSKFNEIISQAKSGKNQLYATQKVSETEYKEF